ncbi:hypothetical protein CUB19_gp56 [Stenotrophomonas phage CUB19]|jgi:hypothetical protein|nr:hypothetical protein CUB19_gp56 [Stenotrophomonas phage CUB19]
MRSEGRNLDIWNDSPERMLERAIAQLEVAKVDPSFYGVVKNDRIEHYTREVEKWRALCQ